MPIHLSPFRSKFAKGWTGDAFAEKGAPTPRRTSHLRRSIGQGRRGSTSTWPSWTSFCTGSEKSRWGTHAWAPPGSPRPSPMSPAACPRYTAAGSRWCQSQALFSPRRHRPKGSNPWHPKTARWIMLADATRIQGCQACCYLVNAMESVAVTKMTKNANKSSSLNNLGQWQKITHIAESKPFV